jgi:hypothetical protein
MDTRQTSLTELEERLAAPDGRVLLERLIRDVSTLELRLMARLAGLVPRNEHAPLVAAIDAARAARCVLSAWVPGTAKNVGGCGVVAR